MKVLVSSKYLAKMLSNIGTEEHVYSAELNENTLSLLTNENKVDVRIVRCIGNNENLKSINGRWDSVYNVVRAIEEQPIVLRLHEKGVTIELQY